MRTFVLKSMLVPIIHTLRTMGMGALGGCLMRFDAGGRASERAHSAKVPPMSQ